MISITLQIFVNLQMAVDSCCALILFRGSSSNQMLSDFLKFRSEAVSRIVSQSGIKQQLQSFLQFIISSFATLHALFVGKELIEGNYLRTVIKYSFFVSKEGFPESSLPQGLLSEKLKATCQSPAPPTVQLLSLTPGFLRQLPPIITEFR
jgi:hypothetical protein